MVLSLAITKTAETVPVAIGIGFAAKSPKSDFDSGLQVTLACGC